MTIPVVAIGASAGGLEAFSSLLSHLTATTGLAFVFVQHLDPRHHSNLTEILARVSPIPVLQAIDGIEVEPNHLYVIPQDAGLEIAGNALRMIPRTPASSGLHLPIDRFLRSLAQECGSRSIAVILSGSGTDGASGLEAVKAAGGVTFVQDPTTATFGSMPQAAIAGGCVDWVLPPEAMAAELAKLGSHPYISEDEDMESLGTVSSDQLDPILALLREKTGIDFTLYRENMVRRRILRRLALRDINSLETYREQIENEPGELSALHRDLLISVTRFFRDPESFENLKTVVFPRLIQDRPAGDAIRIWVAGCATGEEAYSLAISLREYLEAAGRVYPVQIFASDISETVVEKARSGKYPEAITEDVSPERLERYFLRSERGYQINKTLREMCVFSRHDLIQDPPFSKLDLISCRNVLIFFGGVRKNIIALFHYALKPGGFLVLGPAETEASGLFSKVDDSRSIYQKVETVAKAMEASAGGRRRNAETYRSMGISSGEPLKGKSLQKELERTLLARYRGAAVVVDERLEVLETFGQIAPYLALPGGRVSFNLLKLIPETRLFLEIEKLVHETVRTGVAGRKDRIPYRGEGAAGEVNIEVVPLPGAVGRPLLVLFEPVPDMRSMEPDPGLDDKDREIARLKLDLSDARQRLMSLIDDHQSSATESQKATEETISANEELLSLNEELETAKEELQSTNEELATVNQELRSNNAALSEAHGFAMLIIETAAAPILVLDIDLRIKTANPAFYRTFRISPREAEGHHLYSIAKGSWDTPRLREMLHSILPDHKVVQKFEIEQHFPEVGHRVLMLSARQLDGLQQILLGIEDVSERRELDLRLAAIVESSDDAILGENLDGEIVSWNSGAERIYGYQAHEMIGRPITSLAPSGQDQEMASIMERIHRGEKMHHFETKRRRKDGEVIDVSETISPIVGRDGMVSGSSIVARDITELKRRQQESIAKQKLESVGTLAGGIAHDFNNLMGGILAQSELALADLASGSRPDEGLKRIRAVAIRGAEIVRQLMIYAGQENDVLEMVDVTRIVEDMIDLLQVSVSKRATVETNLGKNLPPVRANPAQIRQVVMNLITNASDAIGDRDGVICVTTGRVTVDRNPTLAEGEYVQLEVSDTGRGMLPEVQARIFDPFFSTKPSGHGLGLAVVQGIVRSLRGAVRVMSAPGKGTTFQILLPCTEETPRPVADTSSLEDEAAHGSQSATILFVEDEDSLRQASSQMLRNKGYTVIEAADGTTAVESIRAVQNPIDVLLLDITLPGASSREVLDEARRLRPGLPVIVTSANSEEMAATSLSRRVEHFIRKPYRLGEVLDTIREIQLS
jgi:two-component system CheB/CheR fusion protein